MMRLLKRIQQAIVPMDETFVNLGATGIDPTAAFTTLTTGAAAIGAWTEIEDSLAADTLITHLVVALNATADELGTVQIGTGASGSEAAIITVIVEAHDVTGVVHSVIISFPRPIKVRAGQRISGRFWSTTDATTSLVKLGGKTGHSVVNG